MAKSVLKNINTPKGELQWVFITGDGKKDLNGNDRYQASLYFSEDDAGLLNFRKEVEQFWEENKPKTARKAKSIGIYLELREKVGDKITQVSITQPYDRDELEPTGRVVISAWTTTTNKDGSAKKIKIFGAKNQEVSLGGKLIGNGSVGRLGLTMGIYENGANVGVTLYLNAIQLTKFVEYTAGSSFEVDDEDEDAFNGTEETFDDLEAAPAQEAEEAPAKGKKSVRL